VSLGIAIIGAGGISRAHAEGYRALGPERIRIVGVADVVEERAREAARTWGAQHAVGDYRELLRLDSVDAVSVCTFTAAHCQPTLDALAAGKHVLVEKPLAGNADEGRSMAQAARESGKILMVEMKWRFLPQLLAARRFIADGGIGRPYYAEAIGFQHRGIPGRSFIRKQMAAGGALMDNGVYCLDAVLHLLGHPQPLTVSGTAANVFGHSPDGGWDPEQFDVEDTGSAYVRLAGGTSLYFAQTWAIDFDEQCLIRVAGDGGSVQVRPFGPEPKLRLRSGGYTDLRDVDPGPLPAGEPEVGYAVGQFVDAIEASRPSPVPADPFYHTNLIFDGLYASSQQGREVTITP
jgi:predicted dehydrogenase